jgi:DNA-binding MarR family transcriptional regulator
MAATGLVELADNPHHSRAKLVRLTPAGEAAYAAANAAWKPMGEAAGADLDAAVLDAATATLNHLRRHFERGPADGH